MNFKIDIVGMHCSGCENLIKIYLEEADFNNVKVLMNERSATFSSQQDLSEVKKSLDNIFLAFKQYKYSNLLLV